MRDDCWLTIYVDDGTCGGLSLQKVVGFVLQIGEGVDIGGFAAKELETAAPRWMPR